MHPAFQELHEMGLPYDQLLAWKRKWTEELHTIYTIPLRELEREDIAGFCRSKEKVIAASLGEAMIEFSRVTMDTNYYNGETETLIRSYLVFRQIPNNKE